MIEKFERDPELIKDIRENFSAQYVVEKLFSVAAEMANIIGVTVEWEIKGTRTDKTVDSGRLSRLISQLATLGGAFCLGGHINPIKMLAKRERHVKQTQTPAANREATNPSSGASEQE